MTSAFVNSAALNSDITASFVVTRAQNTSPNQDFDKIMSQAKEKIQQTDGNKNPIQEKKTTHATESLKVVKENVNQEVSDRPQSGVEDNENITDITQNNDKQIIDEKTNEIIEEKVKELEEEICEELEISLEELEVAMAVLGLVPTDLLDSDNLVELLSSFTEDGNMIGLVADEKLYQSLQSLIKLTDELTQELMNETGLTLEELEDVLKQLETVGDDGVVIPEESNIIDFPKVLDETKMTDVKALDEKLSDETEEQSIKALNESHEATDEQIAVSKNTHKEMNQENDDSGHETSDENASGFMNNLKNPTEVSVTDMTKVSEIDMTKMSETEIPTAESIMKQLVDFVKIQNNPEQDLTQMELQLHPASLGSVNVSLTTKGGIVTAQFTTENETVKNAIESQVVQLRAELEEHGVKIDAIEVTVSSHQMERNLEQNNQGQHNNENEYKTDKIQKSHRININLNELEEGSDVEGIEEDDAARIAMEIMKSNGNTMDLMA